MSFEKVTLVKGDREKVAHSPAQLVSLKFDGYLPKTKADEQAVVDTVTPTPFDPSAHSAAEVAAYLADADQGEYDRVYALEAAGKNRSTALA